ncbi:MAG: preprotein translocase subunit SecY [Christensenellaceae bacterium]|nr:preprotein translocase subunit SecY [Christensenellaceae bacterium]
MFETIRNAFKVKEIRQKLIYTFFMLLIYRLVSVIPAPGVNIAAVKASTGSGLDMLDMINMMTGNAFQQMTIMAMGITPYINSSIIMQLLTIAIPALERLQKEGEEGRKKIARITRYVTIGLALFQAIGLVSSLGYIKPGWFNSVLVGVSMSAGTALCMWMGERITEKGIGNGISLLIFAGIISNLFNGTLNLIRTAISRGLLSDWISVFAVLILLVVMIVLVTFVNLGERRIPVNYAKRVRGRKMYGGQSTYMPMKVDASGVLPMIFAYSFMAFPSTIIQLTAPNSGFALWWNTYMNQGSPAYLLITALLIFGFTFFYSSISYDPVEISKNLQENGGMIPGIRSGKATVNFINRVKNRLTMFNAFFLAVVATIPTVATIQLRTAIPFAASSILIGVSVALETMRQLEGQLTTRNYEGFLR